MLAESDKKTYAQRRREQRKGELRELLRGHEYLSQLHKLMEREIAPENIAAARLKADIALRLLAKCLPDQKAIEIAGEIVHSYVAELPELSPTSDQWSKQLTHLNG